MENKSLKNNLKKTIRDQIDRQTPVWEFFFNFFLALISSQYTQLTQFTVTSSWHAPHTSFHKNTTNHNLCSHTSLPHSFTSLCHSCENHAITWIDFFVFKLFTKWKENVFCQWNDQPILSLWNDSYCTNLLPRLHVFSSVFPKNQTALTLTEQDDQLTIFFSVDNGDDIDGLRLLVVLLLQVHRVLRYRAFLFEDLVLNVTMLTDVFLFSVFLRFAQKGRARLPAPRRSPRHHANERLVRSPLHSRWPLDLFRFAQHFRPHCHVLLLHGGCHGSSIPKVHLVEEVPHRFPDGTNAFSFLFLPSVSFLMIWHRSGFESLATPFLVAEKSMRLAFVRSSPTWSSVACRPFDVPFINTHECRSIESFAGMNRKTEGG